MLIQSVVMFNNLEESLNEEARGNTSLAEDNSKYVGFFIKMFSAMRSVYEVSLGRKELQPNLTIRCIVGTGGWIGR